MRFAFALLLLVACPSRAAESPMDFAYGVPLQIDAGEPLYRMEIPASVYRHVTRRDLGDMRVFNGAGEPVPMALEPSPARKSEKTAPLAVKTFPLYGEQASDLVGLRLRVEKGGTGTVVSVNSGEATPPARRKLIAYIIDASAVEQPYEALELDWRQRDPSFAINVRLEASDDLKTWSLLLARVPLVRIDAGGQRLEQRALEFGPRHAKYLRLSWPESAKPVDITRAAVRTGDILHEPERAWLQITARDGGRPGDYLFDLGGAFPVDRFRFELPQVNTVARVALLSRSGPKQQWLPVASTVVYCLAQPGGGEVTSPDLIVFPAADRYWLLRADPSGGGLGGGVPKLSAGWVPQRLVFAARGAGPFWLAYGSTAAQPAAYAIQTLVPGWGSNSSSRIAAAQALAEQVLAGPEVLRPKRDYKVFSLWSALVAGVLLLAWMAWRLARQMRPQTPPPRDGPAEDS